jgi:ubiquinone/menaquinone biosynthesis C-methylase UbiE
VTRSNYIEGLTLFDPLAESYDSWFESPIGRLVEAREKAMLRRLLAPRPGRLILEVGSGTGYFLREIARSGARCVGIEPSAGMMAAAMQAGGTDVSYVRGCAESLPFMDATFDDVVYITTLELVADPGAAVREAARVCKPGGRLVFVVLNARGPWYRQRKKEGGLWATTHFYGARELSGLLAPLGEPEIEYCAHVPPSLARVPGWALRALDVLIRAVRKNDGALLGARIELRGNR